MPQYREQIRRQIGTPVPWGDETDQVANQLEIERRALIRAMEERPELEDLIQERWYNTLNQALPYLKPTNSAVRDAVAAQRDWIQANASPGIVSSFGSGVMSGAFGSEPDLAPGTVPPYVAPSAMIARLGGGVLGTLGMMAATGGVGRAGFGLANQFLKTPMAAKTARFAGQLVGQAGFGGVTDNRSMGALENYGNRGDMLERTLARGHLGALNQLREANAIDPETYQKKVAYYGLNKDLDESAGRAKARGEMTGLSAASNVITPLIWAAGDKAARPLKILSRLAPGLAEAGARTAYTTGGLTGKVGMPRDVEGNLQWGPLGMAFGIGLVPTIGEAGALARDRGWFKNAPAISQAALRKTAKANTHPTTTGGPNQPGPRATGTTPPPVISPVGGMLGNPVTVPRINRGRLTEDLYNAYNTALSGTPVEDMVSQFMDLWSPELQRIIRRTDPGTGQSRDFLLLGRFKEPGIDVDKSPFLVKDLTNNTYIRWTADVFERPGYEQLVTLPGGRQTVSIPTTDLDPEGLEPGVLERGSFRQINIEGEGPTYVLGHHRVRPDDAVVIDNPMGGGPVRIRKVPWSMTDAVKPTPTGSRRVTVGTRLPEEALQMTPDLESGLFNLVQQIRRLSGKP